MTSSLSQAVKSQVVASLGEQGTKLKQIVGKKIHESLENNSNAKKKASSQQQEQQQQQQQPTTPRQILEETMGSTSKFMVKQKFDVLETLVAAAANIVEYGILGRFGEICNKYNVYTDNNNSENDDLRYQYRVVEHSENYGWTGRCLCQPHHKLQLHVHVQQKMKSHRYNNADVFMIWNRECKLGCCVSCCDICRPDMTVHTVGDDEAENLQQKQQQQQYYAAKPMARIREPFLGIGRGGRGWGLSPTLQVMDREGEQMAEIQAEAMCCIGGLCCDHTFTIRHPKTGETIGKIVKVKPATDTNTSIRNDLAIAWAKELFSDGSDVFYMTLPETMDVEHKAALLAALHLIEYWLFEGEGDLSINPIKRTYNCKCCDLYCCGCVCPIGCKSWCQGRCCCC